MYLTAKVLGSFPYALLLFGWLELLSYTTCMYMYNLLCGQLFVNLTEMDEVLSLDTTSVFSSIAEAPVRLDRQYSPLEEVFQSNSADLPDHHTPEPNSEGIAFYHHRTYMYDTIIMSQINHNIYVFFLLSVNDNCVGKKYWYM